MQGAAFYIDAHREAVDMLPIGGGADWLDVGCGHGLIPRLAARRGYHVLGIDRDAGMTRRSMRNSANGPHCWFVQMDLERAAVQHRADVVSASSLLSDMPDPRIALQKLWRCVRPHGHLLVIEASNLMTPDRVRAIAHTIHPKRRLALGVWARSRRDQAVRDGDFQALAPESYLRVPLLGGLIDAWVLEKGPYPDELLYLRHSNSERNSVTRARARRI